ncbi:MAG TPA: HD domain-containing protein [Sedimentisphaerales bacterium]|nr:HD domain-containing protein [Sedimentisphaerales bacterium]
MDRWPDRSEAEQILEEWTKNKNLRKHAYAVEAAMRAYAAKFGEDPEKWGVVGLLHDFDYEKYPDVGDHPFKGVEYLKEQGFSDELTVAILAHAEHTETNRDTILKKCIYAVDELTGLVIAVALVRPSKKLADVKVRSVMKKWKEKTFAAGVDREIIERGAEELGIELRELIETVLKAMQEISEKLGL